jgi:hypothetical protein
VSGSHYIAVLLALSPKDERTLTGKPLASAWPNAYGGPAGLEAMSFSGETRVSGREPIRLERFHPDTSVTCPPRLVLSVIPFSIVGAVWGHILLGHEVSIVSVIGIIAMSGLVQNNALLLVDAYNRLCARGLPHRRAIVEGACCCFHPILLTSLATLFALVPLIRETSEQVQFLIPAAVSISFGLALGTLIALFFVPVLLLFAMRDREMIAVSFACGLFIKRPTTGCLFE